MVGILEPAVRRGVALLRAALVHCLADDTVEDIAFIGNASDVYEWVPSRIVDVDCFVFAQRWGCAAGGVLSAASAQARKAIEALGLDFEMRLIHGPYKPDRSAAQPPIICAHIGLFDDNRYRAQSALSRWAWRKYRCVIEPERLMRLAPPQPETPELIDAIHDRLEGLTSGRTTMTEYELPTLEKRALEFPASTPQFVEFCYSSAATTARHHARVMGHPEPDALANDEFFAWYQSHMLRSEALAELMELKTQSRDSGFSGLGSVPPELATTYLLAVMAALAH